jgi:HAD superfamily hydrolase (TIGR01662 family)
LNRAIFLDRDGTINKEVDYLTKPEQLVLLKGAKKALKTFKDLGYINVIITNQSAVARGYLTEKKLFEIHSRLLELLTHNSEQLVYDIFYCPFHVEGIVKEFSSDSLTGNRTRD